MYLLFTGSMLPSDLLIHRVEQGQIQPKYLPIQPKQCQLAQDLIDVFQSAQGRTQGYLDQQLAELEGSHPDYRIRRGLAHLLRNSFCTFEVVSPLDPPALREKVFTLAAQRIPSRATTPETLAHVAVVLSQQLEHEVSIAQVRQGLYADLPENRILTQFEAPDPMALLHRYNLSQVQGIFYKASHMTLTAHRNDPGEYKVLFKYLKLFQLMTYIEGDADHGFTITVDGPTSLFKPSTRYGLAIAKVIPALLHVTKWSLAATLQLKDPYTRDARTVPYTLNSETQLVTHYPPSKPYDSMLESSFANRWDQLKTEWQLEREVDLIPLPGSVMIPDFRLVHPDGRFYLLEIVGYWRPEYLKKKFAQVRRSECDYLILAVSERLNLDKAGVDVQRIPVPVVWFKDKLQPKAVLEVLQELHNNPP